MFWKAILITTFAIGALAEYIKTEDQWNQYNDDLMEYCKMTAIINYVECVDGIIDTDTLMKEIEEAKPNGAVNEVFKKYCAKSPQVKTCYHTATTGVSPCLDSNMRDYIGLANTATDQLIDFVCYKDGDRIARFIAEGGPECFEEKFNTSRECTTTVRLGINSDELKKLINDENCAKYDEFTTCIVKALEECSTPTSGNLAETMFRYMRYNNPCPIPKSEALPRGVAVSMGLSGLSPALQAFWLPLLGLRTLIDVIV